MAKRLSDTDKWKKPFFRGLPSEYKMLWLYLLDDCDHAGIWHVDTEVAEIRLGIKLSLQKAQGFFKEKIVVFDNGTKWFIPDFIQFQYGDFNETNKMYKSILPVLKRYDLIPHLSPIYGAKVMVKEKVLITSSIITEMEEKEFLTNQAWKEQFCMAKNISMKDLETFQKKFVADVKLKNEPIDSLKRYFTNWYNKVQPKAGQPEFTQISEHEKKLRAVGL